jgi:hypothetical protein
MIALLFALLLLPLHVLGNAAGAPASACEFVAPK